MISNVEADAVLNRLRGITALAVAGELALYNGDPLGAGVELSGGDYSRLALVPANWALPTAGAGGRRQMQNAQALELTPGAVGSWGTATHWAVEDPSGVRWAGALPSPISIADGYRVVVPTGAVSLQLGGSGLVVPSLGLDASVAFVGNSYTQNFGGIPALLAYYLGQRLAGSSVSLGPPPYLDTTIGDNDGWFTSMTLGGMALHPTIDQSGGVGSTDAVDAVLSVPSNTYDQVVLTSDFRRNQDLNPGAGIDWEVLPGAGGTNPNTHGVILEVVRRVASELRAGGVNGVVLRMTHEGFNPNADLDLSDFDRTVRLQVLGARQLENEGVVGAVLPDHYVLSRCVRGASGSVGSGLTSPVPSYAALTHSNSLQPGGANLAWPMRSQGDVAVPIDPEDPDGPTWFPRNSHQNAIATIIHTWAWAYALWDVDPRGDMTFSSPAGLPNPFDDLISPDGSRIYGGHATGAGNWPYDTGINPAGPPDAELDLDWSATTQLQIQERIVAALDDYYGRSTEFD